MRARICTAAGVLLTALGALFLLGALSEGYRAWTNRGAGCPSRVCRDLYAHLWHGHLATALVYLVVAAVAVVAAAAVFGLSGRSSGTRSPGRARP